MTEQVLQFQDEHFIGKGEHKAAYIHPKENNICVKVPFSLPDVDVEKELKYRSCLTSKGLKPSLLTEYYGTVMTEKGLGYMFELVKDYDGHVSLDMGTLFQNQQLLQENYGVTAVELLAVFRKDWLEQAVVTSDVDFGNYYVQRIAAKEFKVRIIDNIGTPAHLPLVYYFDFLAKRRAKRRWNRVIEAFIGCGYGSRDSVKHLYV